MAPLPNVNDVVKMAISWKVDADTTAQTIMHWGYEGGPPNSSSCAALAADLTAAVGQAHAAYGAQVSCIGGEVTDLSSSSGGQGFDGTTTVGTRTGSQLPPAACAVVSHQIARRYRGGKPRSYMPFGTSSDIGTTGLWLVDSAADFLTAWNTILSNLNGVSEGGTTLTTPVCISYYSGSTVRMTPSGRAKNIPTPRVSPITEPILSSTVSTRIGSQRRRNRKA